MSMLVDCSNCHTSLNLPPGARSIRCALCQAVTSIADSTGSSLPTSPSGVHPFPGLAAHMPSLSPYNHDPLSFSGMSPFPGLATDMNSPSPYNHAPPGPPPSVHGRKKAVIVGVSYKFTRHELKGCINDAKYMKHLLISRFQFPEASIVMLTGCQPGDSLLFHYSGHGSRQRNRNGDEIDGYDETLCPLDFETQGMMIDDEINATIVKPLPFGVKLHAIIDSCHSGTVVDLPFLCRMNSSGQYVWEDHRPKSGIWKGSSGGDVISISGCDDDQTSADTSVSFKEQALSKITSTGAMTFCFIQAIEHGNASTYGTLLTSMRNAIRNGRRGVGGVSGAAVTSVFDMLSVGGGGGDGGGGGGLTTSRGFGQTISRPPLLALW
ncbi:Peptidase C14, caspase catalytic [Cynara cardunculus var. scolymus]|uniref:Peptidase C14, caspase catalytic n=1 Tax=Cynara cardunculus var. scolymus TaxID=59895 RepID=A0A103XUP7_CYNCS|nr:Peptidase C14, caspase catalytic [Cynara cardunculus var. scolymus]